MLLRRAQSRIIVGAGSAALQSSGIKKGQVVGATDCQAAYAKQRPVSFTTPYHNLGIDAGETVIEDYKSRPHYLVDNVQPVRELI